MSKPFKVQIADGIAELVIDKPPVNALDVAGWFAFADAVLAAGRIPEVRALVVRAEGRDVDRLIRQLAEAEGARVVVEPRRGYGRAYKTGFRESHGDVIATSDGDGTYPVETIPAAVRRTSSSNFLIIFGVKARDTIRRSRACRGSSMLIIEPKYSLNSTGRSTRLVDPAAEENTSAFRLASTTSACRTSA